MSHIFIDGNDQFIHSDGHTPTQLPFVDVTENPLHHVCIDGSIGKCAVAVEEVVFNQQINSLQIVAGIPEHALFALTSSYFRKMVLNTSTGSAAPIIS